MMTPRQAINQGQVWLRPFGQFIPIEQGYMGFAENKTRDTFLNKIDDGALVVIWTRRKDAERGWVGYFRGILQLTKKAGLARQFSSLHGQNLASTTSSQFEFAVPVIRAWEANPASKHAMKHLIPDKWPEMTRSIGTHSAQMDSTEIGKLENLSVREVSVFGQSTVPSSRFAPIKGLFL